MILFALLLVVKTVLIYATLKLIWFSELVALDRHFRQLGVARPRGMVHTIRVLAVNGLLKPGEVIAFVGVVLGLLYGVGAEAALVGGAMWFIWRRNTLICRHTTLATKVVHHMGAVAPQTEARWMETLRQQGQLSKIK